MACPRFALAVAVLAAATGAACRSGSTAGDEPLDRSLPAVSRSGEQRTRPALEEIFARPGVQGEPPRALELSADGRWLLLHWKPTAEGDGAGGDSAAARALRLIDVESPDATARRGLALTELLPAYRPARGEREAVLPFDPALLEPPTSFETSTRGQSPVPIATWSEHGARLAIARGEEIFLAEAPASNGFEWRVQRLLSAEPDADEELGRIRSLSFERDDRELHVLAGEELWRLPVPSFGARADAWTVDDLETLTRAIESSAAGLDWSEDRRVAFRADPPPAWVPPPGADSSDASERVPAEVVDVTTGAARTLEGMADMSWLEGEQLSPDGRYVFGQELDRSSDPLPHVIPDYLTTRVSTREARRKRADDPPSPRRLWMWSTETGKRTELIVPGGDRYALRSIGWAPAGPSTETSAGGAPKARFAFVRTDPSHQRADYWCWTEGELAHLATDRDERWLGGPGGRARWSHDGESLLFGSESFVASSRPGHNQLFALDPDTRDVRQLTDIDGEVGEFHVLPGGGVLFGFTPREHPELRELAWLPPEAVTTATAGDGARPRLLASGAFDRSPVFAGGSANGGSNVADRVTVFRRSRLGEPDELWAAPLGASRAPWPLTDTVPESFESIDWIRPELFDAPGQRGARVRSHVFTPRSSSLEAPDRPRATIVFIHGAGYLQNVTASLSEYDVNFLFHSRLADMGYVVVDVDYRGSRGYGRDFRTDIQFHLGGLDLDDIHVTVDALAERGVVDPDRVACYGGSYGGFLTLMALFTAPERWVAGCALRSVTDWRTYHPGYTQPRLGRPSERPEAYERSSPIDHAHKLEDPLLVLHGMMDSNVFAQDSVQLIERLIDLGLDFEAMLYPSQGHAFSDSAHWIDQYRRIEDFLLEHLGPP